MKLVIRQVSLSILFLALTLAISGCGGSHEKQSISDETPTLSGGSEKSPSEAGAIAVPTIPQTGQIATDSPVAEVTPIPIPTSVPAVRSCAEIVADPTYRSEEERQYFLSSCSAASQPVARTQGSPTTAAGTEGSQTPRTPDPQCAPEASNIAPSLDTQMEDMPGIRFLFDSRILEADRLQVRRGAVAAASYISANLGSPGLVCIDMRIDESRNGSATAYRNRVFVFTGATGWRGPATSWHLAKVTAHEYAHAWQYSIAGSRFSTVGPNWLMEGSAEFIGYAAVIQAGFVTPSEARQFALIVAKGNQLKLKDTEAHPPAAPQVNYGYVYLALEHLLAGTNVGPLRVYFAAIGAGSDWQSAFANAFGQTSDTFYSVFAGFAASGFQ
jgi:hypothetical protein